MDDADCQRPSDHGPANAKKTSPFPLKNAPQARRVQSHFRKGVAGDWKNYFDDKVKSVFKDAYGHILVATGYESDMDWKPLS